jgi:hypothetical protein
MAERRVEMRRRYETPKQAPVRSIAARKPTPAARETVAEAPTSLSVDDFTRAAQGADTTATNTTPSDGIYARGESHPDDDDRLSMQHEAAPAQPKPSAPKRALAAAKTTTRAKIQPPAAVEAMVVPAETAYPYDPITPSQDNADPTVAPLRAPSRQELTEEVEQPTMLPGLYRNGRLVVPAPLKGTHEILVHQNLMADDEGLERIQDDDDLRRLRAAHLLINFPESASLHINPELAADRRCGRVWSVRFATDISRAFYARFHEPLQVNSAVRTVAYQVRLQRINGNAAGVDGDVASPHLTGQALDLGKRGMSVAQIAWMRAYLLPLMQSGKIDVEEEFQQACFHISVYRTYLPAPPAKRRTEVAQLHVPRVARASVRADDSR